MFCVLDFCVIVKFMVMLFFMIVSWERVNIKMLYGLLFVEIVMLDWVLLFVRWFVDIFVSVIKKFLVSLGI